MAERVDSRKRKNDDYGGVPVIASKRGGPSSEQVVVDGFMIKVLCPESLVTFKLHSFALMTLMLPIGWLRHW